MKSAEVAALLRELLSAIRPLRLADRRPWVQVAVGEVRFESDGIELVFFSDSATLIIWWRCACRTEPGPDSPTGSPVMATIPSICSTTPSG